MNGERKRERKKKVETARERKKKSPHTPNRAQLFRHFWVRGKKFVDSAIPTVNQMSSRPTHPVNPQFLSDLHNLPFGRIFARTQGSVKLSRAGVQGVVQGAGRFSDQ